MQAWRSQPFDSQGSTPRFKIIWKFCWTQGLWEGDLKFSQLESEWIVREGNSEAGVIECRVVKRKEQSFYKYIREEKSLISLKCLLKYLYSKVNYKENTAFKYWNKFTYLRHFTCLKKYILLSFMWNWVLLLVMIVLLVLRASRNKYKSKDLRYLSLRTLLF